MTSVRRNFGHPLATFRPSMGPIRRIAFVGFAGAAGTAVTAFLLKGRSLLTIVQLLVGMAVLFAALVPLLGAFLWPLALSVYTEGIRGRSYWGRRVFIPWAEVAGISAKTSGGMRFLIVKAGAGGPDIWTVPDVVSRAEFQRLISGLAGPASPLRLEPMPAA